MGAGVENLVTPGRTNGCRDRKCDRCECDRGHAYETDAAVLVGMRRLQFQIHPRELEEEICPEQTFPKTKTHQELIDHLADDGVVPPSRSKVHSRRSRRDVNDPR